MFQASYRSTAVVYVHWEALLQLALVQSLPSTRVTRQLSLVRCMMARSRKAIHAIARWALWITALGVAERDAVSQTAERGSTNLGEEAVQLSRRALRQIRPAPRQSHER